MSKADAKAQKKQKFEAVFATLRDELLEHFAAQGMPEDAQQWYRRVSGLLSVSGSRATRAKVVVGIALERGGRGPMALMGLFRIKSLMAGWTISAHLLHHTHIWPSGSASWTMLLTRSPLEP